LVHMTSERKGIWKGIAPWKACSGEGRRVETCKHI
jgi:hypothetical protein